MKSVKLLYGAAIAAIALTLSAPAGLAAAGDECVEDSGLRVERREGSRSDPPTWHSGDDAYHTFAV